MEAGASVMVRDGNVKRVEIMDMQTIEGQKGDPEVIGPGVRHNSSN